jgi:hypothetical protein
MKPRSLYFFLCLPFLALGLHASSPSTWDFVYEGTALPEASSWQSMMSGADAYAKITASGLEIDTLKSGQLPYWARKISWNPKDGFTMEWRTKIMETGAGDGVGAAVFGIRYEDDSGAAMLGLAMGERRVYSAGNIYPLVTGDRFHTYRLALDENHYQIYQDGKKIIEGRTPPALKNPGELAIQFGDHSPGDDGRYVVEYVRWSGKGAFIPDDEDRAEAKAGGGSSFPWMEDGKSVLTLPTPSSPGPGKVDGLISDGEYPVQGTGFFDIHTGEYAAIQSRYFLRSDADAIWICLESPQVGKPVAQGARKDDIRLATDDAMEFFFSPDALGEDVYQIIVNSKGLAYTQHNSNTSWDPNLEIANRVEDGRWRVEVRVPYKDLGGVVPTKETVWRINLCRTFAGETPLQTTMGPSRHSYLSAHQFPYLRFSPELSRFSIVSIGDLLAGQVALKMEVNGSSESFTASASVVENGKVEATETRSFAREGGLSFSRESLPKKGSLNLSAGTSEENILYRSTIPFSQMAEPYSLAYVYADGARENVVCAIELPAFRLRQGGIQLQARLLHNGEPVQTIEPKPALMTEFRFPLKGLAEGDYEVELEVRDSGGTSKLSGPFHNYQPGPAPWDKNGIGITNQVPAPWTDMKRQGQRVSVWNREMEFAPNSFFPTQIESAGEKLLAAPMKLRGRVQGKEIDFLATVEEWPAEGADQIVRKARGTSQGITVETVTRMEFDGFLWTEVSLTSKEEVALDELVLEFAMPPAMATLRNFGDYKMDRTGALGNGTFTKDLTDRPIFWLGNEKAGIQWFAENLKGWRLANQDKSLEVVRSDDRVLTRLNIVDAPVKLKGARLFSFGFMATPVKPRRETNRSWRFRPSETTPPHTVFPWFTEWTKFMNYPVVSAIIPEKLELLEALRAAGLKTLPYATLGATSPLSPEYKFYGEEWRMTPAPRAVRTTATDPQWPIWANRVVCNQSANFRDFYVKAVSDTLKVIDTDGMYFDYGTARMCDNPLHGCGWEDENGVHHSTFNVLGSRELAKRLYRVIREHREDSIIVHHMSGEAVLPMNAFCDVMLNGENFTGALMTQHHYYDVLPFDKFRAEFLDQPKGAVGMMLPQFKRAMAVVSPERVSFFDEPEGIRAIDHMIGLVMLHDTAIWADSGVKPERLWAAQDELGWDEKVVFYPYWESERFVEEVNPVRPDVAVSAYRREDKTMLVVMNNSDEPMNLELKLKKDWLGNADGEWADRYHDGRYAMTNGKIEVPLEPRMFRLLMPAK